LLVVAVEVLNLQAVLLEDQEDLAVVALVVMVPQEQQELLILVVVEVLQVVHPQLVVQEVLV
tara:strand:- start:50 stop:235 length:186 start_codon:yes stop_codon:yes gene_type:complete